MAKKKSKKKDSNFIYDESADAIDNDCELNLEYIKEIASLGPKALAYVAEQLPEPYRSVAYAQLTVDIAKGVDFAKHDKHNTKAETLERILKYYKSNSRLFKE